MIKVTISLKSEDQNFITEAMKTGRYVTESEAVADALAQLRAREEQSLAQLTHLQDKIQLGLRQLDDGNGQEWNLDEIKKKSRAAFVLGQTKL